MIVMALDHVRDVFSNLHGAHFMATDMQRTWPALFFTRWITHFCAPVFVFLAGTGARLQADRKSKRELSWFLLTRGLWIIFLEATWIHFMMTLDIGFHWTLMQVLWAIGASMIVLAGLIWLPTWAVGAIGIAICVGHNLLPFPPHSDVSLPWKILEAGGDIQFDESHRLAFGYPLLPWIGVMAAGYAFGELVPRRDRRQLFIKIGASMIVLFVVIRAINLYGDPSPWAHQRNALYTFMSFVNVTKYPPSLDFILMTLGPAILSLALLDRVSVSRRNFVVVFGRVPMFYYLAHFLVRDILAAIILYIQVGPALLHIHPPFDVPPNMGFGLPGVYLIWAVVVALLYWPCLRWSEYKRAHPDKAWLSYL
jgi:uncharacterized membrane protein